MIYSTLVSTDILADHLNNPDWVIVDCRFVLTEPEAGRHSYHAGHIPGARYAHLNEDLSSPITPESGRHPLPNPKTLAEKLGRWGIDKTTQVVVYDDSLGAIAARLWWLLRWLGHEAVALLDVGYQKWLHEQKPVTKELPTITSTQFHPTVDPALWVDTTFVETAINQESCKLIDARAEERYTGDIEPLDKVAGHIPGAVNVPYEDNLAYDSSFLTPLELRTLYTSALGNKKPESVIHMCGSGVTACHSILAMEIAGLSGSKLYAGSWSEWIRDGSRLVAKGI